MKGQSSLEVRKYSSSQRTVNNAVNEWTKLSADCIHSSKEQNRLLVADYTLCGLSISQRLPCPQPSEVLLGWQSC